MGETTYLGWQCKFGHQDIKKDSRAQLRITAHFSPFQQRIIRERKKERKWHKNLKQFFLHFKAKIFLQNHFLHHSSTRY